MNQKEEKLKEYFLFYQNEVLSKIKTIKEVTQNDYGYHGLLTHTEGVVFRGIFIALAMDKNPMPVIFACACHDLARKWDGYDENHGPNAVPIAINLMNMFDNLLTKEEKKKVIYAIENHTTGNKAPDYISACLRDADRIRLSRDRYYNPDYFNTEPGKQLAQKQAKDFLAFENKILGRKADYNGEWVF